MTSDEIEAIREALNERGVVIDRGLTDAELRAIEEDFGFTFPPDLAELLRTFVPQSADFPNWHAANDQDLIEWFDYPSEGIAFDVEEDGFWLEAWGARPEDVDDAVEEAIRRVAAAPVLVPVHGHCFLPSRPAISGNPVFSVTQSAIMAFASDLPGFFETEFGISIPRNASPEGRTIEFWSELAGGSRR